MEGWADENSRDQVNAITPLAMPAGAGGEAECLTIGVRNAFGGWRRSSFLRLLMRYRGKGGCRDEGLIDEVGTKSEDKIVRSMIGAPSKVSEE